MSSSTGDHLPDGGHLPGGGDLDAGRPDTGRPDTGRPDTGEPDADEPDAGRRDTGEPDAGGLSARTVRRAAPRPHTGRRRNAAARDAILDVTFDLLRTQGASGVTIDAIAEAAGVGRQTIYRWWPTKGAVAAEAMTRGARLVVPERDSGSFTEDLRSFFADSFAALEDPGMRRALRQVVSAAQQDEHVAGVLTEFTTQRRAALRAVLERGQASGGIPAAADLGVLVDIGYGFLWYRLLVGHAPLDAAAADSLTAHLIAAAQART
jgi:AcrR family transcriptional regulator